VAIIPGVRDYEALCPVERIWALRETALDFPQKLLLDTVDIARSLCANTHTPGCQLLLYHTLPSHIKCSICRSTGRFLVTPSGCYRPVRISFSRFCFLPAASLLVLYTSTSVSAEIHKCICTQPHIYAHIIIRDSQYTGCHRTGKLQYATVRVLR
jgi:hypothetical protein